MPALKERLTAHVVAYAHADVVEQFVLALLHWAYFFLLGGGAGFVCIIVSGCGFGV